MFSILRRTLSSKRGHDVFGLADVTEEHHVRDVADNGHLFVRGI